MSLKALIVAVFLAQSALIYSKTLIRTDTILTEDSTLFLCSWYKLSKEDLAADSGDVIHLITDTIYNCDVSILNRRHGSNGSYKITAITKCSKRKKMKQTFYFKTEEIEQKIIVGFTTYCLGKMIITLVH